MIKKLRIFVDSDVVISSMISAKGAAYLLINTSQTEIVISNYSKKEVEVVAKRMGIAESKQRELLDTFQLVKLEDSKKEIKHRYEKYVTDKNDAHIVAGSASAKVRFLITYNVRDYKIENIKRDLDIIILTPGMLLQYLRSKSPAY